MGRECRYSASTNEQNVNSNSATFSALSLKLKSRFPAKRVVCTSNKQEKKTTHRNINRNVCSQTGWYSICLRHANENNNVHSLRCHGFGSLPANISKTNAIKLTNAKPFKPLKIRTL